MRADDRIIQINSMKRTLSVFWASILFAFPAFSEAPATRLNPMVKEIVDKISEQRIAAILRKLEGFGPMPPIA